MREEIREQKDPIHKLSESLQEHCFMLLKARKSTVITYNVTKRGGRGFIKTDK